MFFCVVVVVVVFSLVNKLQPKLSHSFELCTWRGTVVILHVCVSISQLILKKHHCFDTQGRHQRGVGS